VTLVARREEVVLIDGDNRVIGRAEKLRAHQEGRLHRAFSVFIFDQRGALLLQRRALGKYHSAGRWSNTCCGHPRPEEETRAAAERRLHEEMGFRCTLFPAFEFRYRARVGPTLHEHEHDAVFVGSYSGRPTPDPNEVADWRYSLLSLVRGELRQRPNRYTIWLRLLLAERFGHLRDAARGLLCH
jgi:isopentenyl-diphosphate delta-isomerase